MKQSFLKSQVTQEYPGFHPSFSSMSHPHLREQLNYVLHGNRTQRYIAAFYCSAWLGVTPHSKRTAPALLEAACYLSVCAWQLLNIHITEWYLPLSAGAFYTFYFQSSSWGCFTCKRRAGCSPKVRLCLPEMHARGYCRARSVSSSQSVNKSHQKPPKGWFKQCTYLFTQVSCTVSEKWPICNAAPSPGECWVSNEIQGRVA